MQPIISPRLVFYRPDATGYCIAKDNDQVTRVIVPAHLWITGVQGPRLLPPRASFDETRVIDQNCFHFNSRAKLFREEFFLFFFFFFAARNKNFILFIYSGTKCSRVFSLKLVVHSTASDRHIQSFC